MPELLGLPPEVSRKLAIYFNSKEGSNLTIPQRNEIVKMAEAGEHDLEILLDRVVNKELRTITIESEENDDWMKALSGYQDEIAIIESLEHDEEE